MKIEQGRNFSKDFETDKSDALMMNEAALKDIGWKSISDGYIIRGKTNRKIVGLIKDFNYESLESPIGPVVFFFRSLEDGSFNYLTVKVSGKDIPETLSYIKSKWSIVDPSREFDYFFVDRKFDSLYSTQESLPDLLLSLHASDYLQCLR